MSKQTLSGRDICTKFITPALKRSGWDEFSQIREEVSFTKGRIIVRGRLVTRGKAQRAENVRKRDVFTKYGPQARAMLEALLQKYQDEGVTALDDPRILQIAPFTSMGTPVQFLKQFGGRPGCEQAVHTLQSALYAATA